MTDKERLENIKRKSREYDYGVTREKIEWLIEQAEKVEEINEEAAEFWDGEIDLSDFGERVLNIISKC